MPSCFHFVGRRCFACTHTLKNTVTATKHSWEDRRWGVRPPCEGKFRRLSRSVHTFAIKNIELRADVSHNAFEGALHVLHKAGCVIDLGLDDFCCAF